MKLDIEDEKLNELLKRCVAGDEVSWNDLHKTCGEMVFRYCYSRTRHKDRCCNESDAGDIANEVWLRVFRGLPKFRAESSFTTWLFKIAHHAICDFHSGIEPITEHEVEMPEDEDGSPVEFPGVGPDPGKVAEQQDRVAAIERVLSKVPAQCREVFELARLQLSGREMAEILEEPEGSISARLTRCRKNAMRLLQEAGLVDSQS